DLAKGVRHAMFRPFVLHGLHGSYDAALAANRPRSVFTKRASFPFSLISRRIALYSVACGVLPPGLVQMPFAASVSIISLQPIGSFDPASSFAAASMALTFLVFASTSVAGVLAFLARVASSFLVSSGSSW